MRISARILVVLLSCAPFGAGCAAVHFASELVAPSHVDVDASRSLALEGLAAPVEAHRRADGIWRIEASSEIDALRAQGYLMARDRTAQLDILRHLARGELASLVGERPFGGRSALETDRLNRFMGFRENARHLYEGSSPQERAALDAHVSGINAWLTESPLPPEHRLIGVDTIRPWKAEDSLSIYLMFMSGLASNADRELRRLALACEAGLETALRIWPGDIEEGPPALPDEDIADDVFEIPPVVAPELGAELEARCEEGRRDAAPSDRAHLGSAGALAALSSTGRSSSNNWAVAGSRSESGHPILSSDPHLPHMNPPVVWGAELVWPGHHVVGFTLPGLHRIVFGHNGHVAFGATTNHVDRQDLVVLRGGSTERDGRSVPAYELEGEFVPFELRTETFAVRGDEPVDFTARFTRDGPVLNDIDSMVTGRIPLTALRRVPIGRGRDLDGSRGMNHARDAADLVAALDDMDAGCVNWVFADTAGHIGYRSPCLVPIRRNHRGTFAVPGWSRAWDWNGLVDKAELPKSDDPERGWLATANSTIVPARTVATAYNNDASSTNRFRRIRDLLADTSASPLDAKRSAHLQHDATLAAWPQRRAVLTALCDGPLEGTAARAQGSLCGWDGVMDIDSAGALVWVLLSHELIDRALGDELEAGASSWALGFATSLHQFEANLQHLWERDPADAIWDDPRTTRPEDRDEIVRSAFEATVARLEAQYGDQPSDWGWGTVRPFELRHPFASGGGILGRVFNRGRHPLAGGPVTVFKQQFARSHREGFQPEIGPVVRITVDLAAPWSATFSLAGGQNGWPGSAHNADLLKDWATGVERPLTPAPTGNEVRLRFTPSERGA